MFFVFCCQSKQIQLIADISRYPLCLPSAARILLSPLQASDVAFTAGQNRRFRAAGRRCYRGCGVELLTNDVEKP